jgi:hypothetical protein
MERSFDGRMIEIYSNVGKIKGYLEKQEVLGNKSLNLIFVKDLFSYIDINLINIIRIQ